MRSVNIAELKNRLNTYVTFARGGGKSQEAELPQEVRTSS
jgi:hypothetical protein